MFCAVWDQYWNSNLTDKENEQNTSTKSYKTETKFSLTLAGKFSPRTTDVFTVVPPKSNGGMTGNTTAVPSSPPIHVRHPRFQNFRGSMPPDPPSLGRTWRSQFPSCAYVHLQNLTLRPWPVQMFYHQATGGWWELRRLNLFHVTGILLSVR